MPPRWDRGAWAGPPRQAPRAASGRCGERWSRGVSDLPSRDRGGVVRAPAPPRGLRNSFGGVRCVRGAVARLGVHWRRGQPLGTRRAAARDTVRGGPRLMGLRMAVLASTPAGQRRWTSRGERGTVAADDPAGPGRQGRATTAARAGRWLGPVRRGDRQRWWDCRRRSGGALSSAPLERLALLACRTPAAGALTRHAFVLGTGEQLLDDVPHSPHEIHLASRLDDFQHR